MNAPWPPPVAFAVRRTLVWLVAVALMVYGQSSSIMQMLGAAHRHAVAVQLEPAAWSDGVETMFRDIRAWRDNLHARLLPEEEVHAHPHADGGSHSPHDGLVAAEPMHGLQVAAHTHTHFHSAFQRHHHDPHDPSVITMDGKGAADTLADASAQASAGSATLTLGLAAGITVPSPGAKLLAWRRSAPAAWADALPELLERPPRA